MTQSYVERSLLVALASLSCLLSLLLWASPVDAQSGSPAYPVTRDLWNGGALQPVDNEGTRFPPTRDSTAFNEFRQLYSSVPWFMSLDVEEDTLVLGLAHGFQVYNTQPNPADPNLIGTGRWTDFLELAGGETKWPGTDIDMPTGSDDSLAYVGPDEIGLSIWDITNKSQPRIAYQRPAQGFAEVYATRINNRNYAFSASGVEGLTVFDMTAALQAPRPCRDDAAGNACRSTVDGKRAYLGTLGFQTNYSFVDGEDNFVAAARPAGGFEIWNVSGLPVKPTQPRLSALTTNPVYGVALWRSRSDNEYYLGLVTNFFQVGSGVVNEGRIYNVDCIRTSCGANGAQLVWSQRVGRASSSSFVTYSESNGIPFLYFGNDNRTEGGPQREFLMDVTNPNNPQDVTPARPAGLDLPAGINYWSWYYERNSGSYVSTDDVESEMGFKNVGPRRGMFHGSHFYRAAWSIFDVHRLGALTCTLVIDDPVSREPNGKFYPGSRVELTALTSGCQDTPDWSLDGGTFVENTSSTSQTIVVEIDSNAVAGQDSLTVTLTPGPGDTTGSPVSEIVALEDPTPRAAGITISPANPLVCQQVTFRPTSPAGRPVLGSDWEVSDGALVVAEGSGDPFSWDSSQGGAGGVTYDVQLTMSSTKAAGGQTLNTTFTLGALPDLNFTNGIGITPDPPDTGFVAFDANSVGASVWRWDFGDLATNECPDGFNRVTIDNRDWCETRDPVLGDAPDHSYNTVGVYTVTVEVDDCFELTPPIRQTRDVTITSIAELIADFRVGCFGNLCGGFVNESLPVQDRTSGDPEFWDYDWNGDGTFEDVGNTAPVTAHAYTSVGTFFPKLRVRRGGQEEVFEDHPAVFIERNAPPPPPPQPARITVSGQTNSGVVDTLYNFRATASNCNPSATAWSWSLQGGTASGNTNRNQINVQWSSPGTYRVRATNTGCSGATVLAATIVITTEGGPGPGPNPTNLDATFDVIPASPVQGQAAVFTARYKDADSYLWDFGDGSPTVETTEPTIQHVFATESQFQVTLEAAERIEGQGCFLNVCIEEFSRIVQVVPGQEPPPPVAVGPICEDDPNAFCLVNDRFKVSVEWTDQRSGDSGIGRPVIPAPLGDDLDTTGFFYFFTESNTELIVKAIDGRGINGNYWIFYGSLSDVEYTLVVEDRQDGMVREYHNEPGNSCGRVDLSAFTDDNLRRVLDAASLEALHNTDGPPDDSPPEQEPTDGPCVPDSETLCLQDGRFQVEVDWQVISVEDGESGHGHVIPGNQETGYFWFFEPSTAELVVKILDGTSNNDHFWVFFGGLTKEQYEVTVTDLETGVAKVFANDPGSEAGTSICGGADIRAFESHPEEEPAP